MTSKNETKQNKNQKLCKGVAMRAFKIEWNL